MKAVAHPFSMSRSELRLEGTIARLEIRLPKGEMEHLTAANRNLVHLFRVGGDAAVSSACDLKRDEYLCWGTFLAPQPLEVESRLPEAILTHHIHSLVYAGRTYVFTASATKHNLEAGTPSLWWAAGGFVLILLVAGAFKNSRWRRNFLDRG